MLYTRVSLQLYHAHQPRKSNGKTYSKQKEIRVKKILCQCLTILISLKLTEVRESHYVMCHHEAVAVVSRYVSCITALKYLKQQTSEYPKIFFETIFLLFIKKKALSFYLFFVFVKSLFCLWLVLYFGHCLKIVIYNILTIVLL